MSYFGQYLESNIISNKGTEKVKKHIFGVCLHKAVIINNVIIELVIQHKNLLNFAHFCVICEFCHTFWNIGKPKMLLCYVEAVDLLY